MKKHRVAIILTLIVLFGLFLRFYQLGRQSYWMDEGYTINAVISAAHNGYANGSSLLDSGGQYFCPLYCYPTQLISQAVGQNAVAYRLLAAFFGIIFIILAYFLTKIFFQNKKAALLTAFFVAASYWQIAWSRQARWYTELEVFFWLALLFFYLFLNFYHSNFKKYLYLGLAIIFTIAAIATHKLAYLLPLIMLAWYLLSLQGSAAAGGDEAIPDPEKKTGLLHFVRNDKVKKSFIAILAAAALVAFAEYGLGLHFIAHALKNVSFHYNLPYYLSFYLRNYWFLLEIVIYGYISATPAQRRKMTLLLLPFLIYLIFLSFFTQIIHYRYLFHANLFIYILSAVTIIDIFGKIREKSKLFPLQPELDLDIPVAPASKTLPALLKNSFLWIIAILALIIILYFATGEGVIFPKNSYLLESDNPTKLHRPYYAYTPQPDFNAAYAAIKNNLQPGEIVISSHPHFNKIFLNQPGYWIKYNYLGMEDTPNTIFLSSQASSEGSVPYYREYYVGAAVINNLAELKNIIQTHHGYIVFDYMATDGRIDPAIINYIQKTLPIFFYNRINSYSQIWVYKF
jgi:hypothetical protein